MTFRPVCVLQRLVDLSPAAVKSEISRFPQPRQTTNFALDESNVQGANADSMHRFRCARLRETLK
jgi:hypothetical protein